MLLAMLLPFAMLHTKPSFLLRNEKRKTKIEFKFRPNQCFTFQSTTPQMALALSSSASSNDCFPCPLVAMFSAPRGKAAQEAEPSAPADFTHGNRRGRAGRGRQVEASAPPEPNRKVFVAFQLLPKIEGEAQDQWALVRADLSKPEKKVPLRALAVGVCALRPDMYDGKSGGIPDPKDPETIRRHCNTALLRLQQKPVIYAIPDVDVNNVDRLMGIVGLIAKAGVVGGARREHMLPGVRGPALLLRQTQTGVTFTPTSAGGVWTEEARACEGQLTARFYAEPCVQRKEESEKGEGEGEEESKGETTTTTAPATKDGEEAGKKTKKRLTAKQERALRYEQVQDFLSLYRVRRLVRRVMRLMFKAPGEAKPVYVVSVPVERPTTWIPAQETFVSLLESAVARIVGDLNLMVETAKRNPATAQRLLSKLVAAPPVGSDRRLKNVENVEDVADSRPRAFLTDTSFAKSDFAGDGEGDEWCADASLRRVAITSKPARVGAVLFRGVPATLPLKE